MHNFTIGSTGSRPSTHGTLAAALSDRALSSLGKSLVKTQPRHDAQGQFKQDFKPLWRYWAAVKLRLCGSNGTPPALAASHHSQERAPPPSTSHSSPPCSPREGQPLALLQLTEPSPGRVLPLGVLGVCVRTDRWMESWRAARVTGAAWGDSADGQWTSSAILNPGTDV